jgi:hypothetical protein
LFRADSRGPEVIFNEGFKPWGDNLDLEAHVTGESQDSGYVATSRLEASAQRWAAENGYDYVYKLRGSGVDVNDALGLTSDSPFYAEQETAIPGPVPPSAVEGALGPEGWVGNPFFNP